MNNCRTNQAAVWSSSVTPALACALPSPPPPSSTWVAVTAAISVVGYTANTFGSSQQTAFAAVLSAQLYVPTSSVQINNVVDAASVVGRHRRLHQASGSGVTVAFTVTATSSSAASNLAASITNMAVSPSFVAALQSGGLPAASATALATAPNQPAPSRLPRSPTRSRLTRMRGCGPSLTTRAARRRARPVGRWNAGRTCAPTIAVVGVARRRA